MRKIILALVITAGMAMVSTADINVRWFGLDGFVKDDGSTPMLDGGGTSIAILVFSASGSFYGTLLSPGSHTIGDEVILGSPTDVVYDPLDPYGFVTASTFSDTFQSGVIYARVFDEGTTVNPSSVVAGLWYYQGPMVGTVDNTTPINPDIYDMNTGSANIPDFNTDVLNRQVVPEPSTLAFLGLGGLALALRRRFVA